MLPGCSCASLVKIVRIHAGGSARILEADFNVTGSSLDYNVCRLSAKQPVYMDEEMDVGAWRGAATRALPLSSAPQDLFLTEDNFLGLQEEVCLLHAPVL